MILVQSKETSSEGNIASGENATKHNIKEIGSSFQTERKNTCSASHWPGYLMSPIAQSLNMLATSSGLSSISIPTDLLLPSFVSNYSVRFPHIAATFYVTAKPMPLLVSILKIDPNLILGKPFIEMWCLHVGMGGGFCTSEEESY